MIQSIIKTIFLSVILTAITSPSFSQKHKTVKDVKGIAVGSKIAMFSATDQAGKLFKLANALKKGPVVVLFYRGQWCPVCNRHLSKLQDSLQLIYNKGATVIAISPEKPEYLEKTAVKTKATFTLLYDKNYAIAEAFDVVFNPTEKEVSAYNDRLNANLERANANNSTRLPVPATYIINKKGVVVWREFNPDYRVRASVADIIKNIPTPKK